MEESFFRFLFFHLLSILFSIHLLSVSYPFAIPSFSYPFAGFQLSLLTGSQLFPEVLVEDKPFADQLTVEVEQVGAGRAVIAPANVVPGPKTNSQMRFISI